VKLETNLRIAWWRTAGGTGPVQFLTERGTVKRVAKAAVLAEMTGGERKWVDKDRVFAVFQPAGGFQ